MTRHRPERRRSAPPAWIMVGLIVLVAGNLRPAVTSLAPFLDDVLHDLHLGGATAGLLTALPVLCFATFGAIAPALARRVSARVLVGTALAVAGVGLAARALAPNGVVFFAASTLALAAMAMGNVLVPALIRRHFPDRLGPVTGLFSMGLSLGTTLAAAGTVPLGALVGHGWRGGLGGWAVLALGVALPWLLFWPSGTPAAGQVRMAGAAGVRVPRPRLLRSVTAWTLAVFFGCQALSAYVLLGWLPQIYRDAGVPAGQAGLLLALTTGLSIPVALLLPTLAARRPNQGPLAVALTLLTGAGYLGLAFAPASQPWLWAFLVGVGNGCFPLAITMIGLRARVAAHTAALSGFVQSVGYLLAAVGPLAAGGLYEATGGWHIPLAMLGAFLVPQAAAGFLAGRPRHVEDDIGGEPASAARSADGASNGGVSIGCAGSGGCAGADVQANAVPGGGSSSGASQGRAASSPTRNGSR